MAGEQGWSNVSFTPNRERPRPFGSVGVDISNRAVFISGPTERTLPEDIIGPIIIVVTSTSASAIAEFEEGVVGTLQGTRPEDGILYSASNAKVLESRTGYLKLQAVSLDRASSPVATSALN